LQGGSCTAVCLVLARIACDRYHHSCLVLLGSDDLQFFMLAPPSLLGAAAHWIEEAFVEYGSEKQRACWLMLGALRVRSEV